MWRDKELEGWRRGIDRADTCILKFLGRRFWYVRKIKALKKRNGKLVVVPERERALMADRLKKGINRGLDPLVVLEIWGVIIRKSREVQNE